VVLDWFFSLMVFGPLVVIGEFGKEWWLAGFQCRSDVGFFGLTQ
jgi:hypothetical protein